MMRADLGEIGRKINNFYLISITGSSMPTHIASGQPSRSRPGRSSTSTLASSWVVVSPRDRRRIRPANIIRRLAWKARQAQDALLSFAIAKDNSVIIDHTRFLADLDLLLERYSSCDVADIDIRAFLNISATHAVVQGDAAASSLTSVNGTASSAHAGYHRAVHRTRTLCPSSTHAPYPAA